MRPKDDNQPKPKAPMDGDSSSSLDVIVEETSGSGVRVSGAQVVGERSDAPPEGIHDPRIGETLVGRYRLEKLVGKGGMGRVYRATQFPLNRPVAVKILNPEFQRKDPQFVRRFFLEAASAARLTHPNTITVFDYGEAESGELFIAMEYLKGRPLSKVITTEAPFPGERTLRVAMQICRALREAHSKGIIHRDLKPGNIHLLEEGDDADFVKVLDFGLVKLFTPNALERESSFNEPLTPGPVQDGDLTKAGMFLGSPKYMSPEQIQAIPLDPRTDIYSLGVLMFQMATGKAPFTGATSVEVIYKHVNEPIPVMSSVVPGLIVPPELEACIAKCLAKDREERFASMADLLIRMKDVKRLVTGVSSASESGLSMDRRGMESTGGVVAEDPSYSVSIRPQTHPVRGSAMPRATSIEPEAAFSEVHIDANPTNSVMALQRGSGLAKIAPALAVIAFMIVLGVFAYVMSRPAPSVAPPVSDAPLEARVRFTSVPPGAEVFEDGVSLGRTPLTFTHPRSPQGSPPRQFRLELAGYHDEIHQAAVDSASVDISVRMRAKPADPTSEDYKENPY